VKIATLNLGYNVMANKPIGTEKPLVELCQSTYAGGWTDNSQRLASCTLNAARFLTTYDIFALQEVNGNYRIPLQSAIQSLNPQADYGFLVAEYFKNWFVMLGYNRKVTGDAVELYRGLVVATDPQTGKANPDQRAIQIVYFPRLTLMVINLHVAHRINLKEVIQNTLQKAHIKLPDHDFLNLRVVMMGDFNDENGTLITRSIRAFGHDLTVPGRKSVLACCTDSDYRLPGDYILLSENLLSSTNNDYGFPQGYVRHQPLMSDHDPVVVTVHLKLFTTNGKPQAEAEYTGVVVTSGDYVELRLLDIDEDDLFSVAKQYVKQKELPWKIRKPHAWTDYGSAPHVTLHRSMKKYLGQQFTVKVINRPYHFTSDTSHWVALPVELSEGSPLKCEHECHVSIAQQRL
jgi:endonuclease/exonuclease/phosphatase family metal-dependent hydrolase